MTDLSPAAQAVLDAASDVYWDWTDMEPAASNVIAAAALRAAADQVGQTPADIGNPEWREGVLLVYRHLLAIAAELEGAGG